MFPLIHFFSFLKDQCRRYYTRYKNNKNLMPSKQKHQDPLAPVDRKLYK